MKKAMLISGLAITMLGACGEMKKLDEMHDSTIKMDKTTGDMSQTTSEMNKTTGKMSEITSQMNDTTSKMSNKMTSVEKLTESLKNITDELYDTLRQGNAMQFRREAYDAIMKAPDMFKKVSEATKYYMSFELQIWNPLGQDLEPAKREILAQQEAQEFFLEIEGIATRDNSINPTAQPHPDQPNFLSSLENRQSVFNALAAAMHQMNRKQPRAQEQSKNLKVLNMYTMIEEALLSSREEVQKGYIREILIHEDKAIQLLQARLNILPLMFIDAVIDLGDKGLIDKAKMALIGWDLDLDKLSATQLDFFQKEVLDQALLTKKLLAKIGKPVQLDQNVMLLLKKMRIKASGKTGAVAAAQTSIVGQMRELMKN